MARTRMANEDAPEVLSATPARQGMRGIHVLWVLAISLILVAMALFGSWAFRAGDLAAVSPNNRATISDAQKTDAGPPAVRQNETQ